MPETLLKIQNLSFSFGEQKILNNFSMRLEAGEVVTLIGCSGAGKTTLFKILTGILTPEHGTLTSAGHLTETISYMTQEDLLLPWRTVLGNLLLLSELGKQSRPTHSLHTEALAMLAEMGLKNCANVYPDQLSGGMRQRVSLARALLQKRPLMLLDEPFASLDVVLREQIYQLLRKMKDKLGCTILMVTHDFHDALHLSDRILLMHEGVIHKTWNLESNMREDPILSAQVAEEIRKELFVKAK